ncbi:MAG: hypothetical protein KJ058_00750 [Thermoanaerobaculia bacterium]|nr:hypothetical protein [Thermoanaerobaculia bacterium]MCZ7652248.1 M12 family metallo-peptidase [Thermoanaerobaculia bacterium]
MRKASTILGIGLLAALAGGSQAAGAAETSPLWYDAGEREAAGVLAARTVEPLRARLVALDRAALEARLAAAPSEVDAPRGLDAARLEIPHPDGRMLALRVVDSPVVEPGLAERYPELHTFRLIGADDPALVGRGSWTPRGFHAMLRTPEGLLLVDPLAPGETYYHQAYFRADLGRGPDPEWSCGVTESAPAAPVAGLEAPLAAGPPLRTYRLALATTGEYSVAVCGASPTKPCVLAELVVAMNRINFVYEQDVAIRMVLIANNDLVIYLNGATDPYTNNNGSTMLTQNQTNLDAVILSANYDIGHVFSTGGGGIAGLGVVCRAGLKARGVTGLPNPVGDPFYIDFVAHEMGHQWSGNHTFNGSAGNCSGGNRNGSTAYEPGSGSTIMAYAGICSPQNLQPNSDPYFHAVSLDEIVNYSRSGLGNGCAATVPHANEVPVASAGSDYTIPHSTPFVLTGTASDANGDPLTYAWEEWDLGPAGAPTAPSGDAPIFRSFNPTPSPTRIFPKISDLVNNTSTIGELLPFAGRVPVDMRLTVRDNSSPAGAFASDFTVLTIAGSGPFAVTAPNTAVTWSGQGPHTVTWNVAGTDAAPVSCAAVDILLSTDGGYTYPQTLLAGTPNDGSAQVFVATSNTTTARIQVKCATNVFFDISNANFEIVGAVLFADGFESGNLSLWSHAL